MEAIVGAKTFDGRLLFHVRWRGFDASHDTFEPEENLGKAKALLLAFRRSCSLVRSPLGCRPAAGSGGDPRLELPPPDLRRDGSGGREPAATGICSRSPPVTSAGAISAGAARLTILQRVGGTEKERGEAPEQVRAERAKLEKLTAGAEKVKKEAQRRRKNEQAKRRRRLGKAAKAQADGGAGSRRKDLFFTPRTPPPFGGLPRTVVGWGGVGGGG